MRQTPGLLAELHAHSVWSDGELTLRELVDLYGDEGFDVLCVTDHALPSDDLWLATQRARGEARHIDAVTFPAYRSAIESEARRALARYGLLVVPGYELTWCDPYPERAAHVVALGVDSFVSPDLGLRPALAALRADGAALVAAHPHADAPDPTPLRTTKRFWRERDALARLVDRFELVNRSTVFGWVAEAGLPAVASGDFHRPEHLGTWKTIIPCDRTSEAVVDYLCGPGPVLLTPYTPSFVRGIAA